MTESITPPEIAAYFRQFTARRRRSDRPCAVCGQVMENALLKQRYCSLACRSRAHYQRHASELAAEARARRAAAKATPAPTDPATPSANPARGRPTR